MTMRAIFSTLALCCVPAFAACGSDDGDGRSEDVRAAGGDVGSAGTAGGGATNAGAGGSTAGGGTTTGNGGTSRAGTGGSIATAGQGGTATCTALSPAQTASDGWSNLPQSTAHVGLDVEFVMRATVTQQDALIALSDGAVSTFASAPILVRFNDQGFFDARDGDAYASDTSLPYEPGTWYSVAVSVDLGARTYDVSVGPCGQARTSLVTAAAFRSDAPQSDTLDNLALWSSSSEPIDVGDVRWSTTGQCVPKTCADLSAGCGTPSDGCGGLLSCGDCPLPDPDQSVTQGPITWEFDDVYPIGTFANGDHYVIAQGSPPEVRIVSITPASTDDAGRIRNGSMLNPDPKACSAQAYDNSAYTMQYSAEYDANLNVAFGVSAGSPLVLSPGDSLVSSVSVDADAQRPQVKSAEVLTVLASAPPTGSFRPPYAGTDKTIGIEYTVEDLDYSVLPSLPKVGSPPALATVEADFERVWLDHVGGDKGRYIHPTDNMDDYGRDLSKEVSEGVLSLLLDYTPAEKQTLLIRIVQLGIDDFGVARVSPEVDCELVPGIIWEGAGALNQGRKLPILIAGLVLGDAEMLALADAGQNFIFQEDRQIWYVTDSDVGRTLYTADGRPRSEYVASDVGMPEWGEQHASAEERDGRNWNATYRTIVGGSIIGHVLAAHLLGATGTWNYPALFDYMDRYWECEKDSARGGTNEIPIFEGAMWEAYRGTNTFCTSNPTLCPCP